MTIQTIFSQWYDDSIMFTCSLHMVSLTIFFGMVPWNHLEWQIMYIKDTRCLKYRVSSWLRHIKMLVNRGIMLAFWSSYLYDSFLTHACIAQKYLSISIVWFKVHGHLRTKVKKSNTTSKVSAAAWCMALIFPSCHFWVFCSCVLSGVSFAWSWSMCREFVIVSC
jgi:hypothetical protein